MSKKYAIRYLPLFYNDLEKITHYIAYNLSNSIAANDFVDALEKEIQERAYNPTSYEKYTSNKKRKNTYYKIYVKIYTVFYSVSNNVMEIRRLLYSKRNFDKLV